VPLRPGGNRLSERFSIAVDGLKIAGEIYRPPKPSVLSPALCICHGIPAASALASGDPGYPGLAELFAREGFLTCIFNFRGCGESEGNLDLLDWTRDLDGILTYLSRLEGVDRSRLSVMGFSGGAAASACVAARDARIRALVLCACPAEFSIGGLGRSPAQFVEQCRIVGTIRDPGFPPSLEVWARHFDEVSPIRCIEKISPRPLLIVHGTADETIPPDHAAMLFEKAGEPRELAMIPDGKHRLRNNEAAMNAVLEWLKRVNHLSSVRETIRQRGCRDSSLPGFGVSPNPNIPQDWGTKGAD